MSAVVDLAYAEEAEHDEDRRGAGPSVALEPWGNGDVEPAPVDVIACHPESTADLAAEPSGGAEYLPAGARALRQRRIER